MEVGILSGVSIRRESSILSGVTIRRESSILSGVTICRENSILSGVSSIVRVRSNHFCRAFNCGLKYEYVVWLSSCSSSSSLFNDESAPSGLFIVK